jgi:hypothetical protein
LTILLKNCARLSWGSLYATICFFIALLFCLNRALISHKPSHHRQHNLDLRSYSQPSRMFSTTDFSLLLLLPFVYFCAAGWQIHAADCRGPAPLDYLKIFFLRTRQFSPSSAATFSNTSFLRSAALARGLTLVQARLLGSERKAKRKCVRLFWLSADLCIWSLHVCCE